MRFNKKSAQSLIEYGLILALVAVVAITALQFLGGKVNKAATDAGNQIGKVGDESANNYCKSIGYSSWNSEQGKCE